MNFREHATVIFETIAGSRLYGTDLPDSDFDFRGVCTIPVHLMIHPFQGFEQMIQTKEIDRVIYHLPKFFDLAASCNPNIIELLFAPDDTIIELTSAGKKLIGNRELFLSKKAVKTFTGYAESQRRRMILHKSWVDNPLEKPERKDFDLPASPRWSYDKLNAMLAAPPESIRPQVRQYAVQEMLYRNAKKAWDDYKHWVDTRNPKRFELEKKFGYDTKMGMHLVRLLQEGMELLEKGTITFPRPNSKMLVDIRNGLYRYDSIMEFVGNLRDKFDNANCVVPSNPDKSALLDLYYRILEITWK